MQPAAEEIPDELRGGALTRNPPRVDVCPKAPDMLQWQDTRGNGCAALYMHVVVQRCVWHVHDRA